MRVGYKRRHTASVVIIPLLCTVVFLCFCIHIFLKRAEPSFVAQTSNYSNTAFTDLVNKCILDIASKDEFSGFFNVTSTDGVSMVESNTAKINLMTSELLINVQNSLNNAFINHSDIFALTLTESNKAEVLTYALQELNIPSFLNNLLFSNFFLNC